MKRTWPARLLTLLLLLTALSCARKAPARPDYSLSPVPASNVRITDDFWAPKQETNRRVSIWHCFKKFAETTDFDSPKLIEAAAYMLAARPDPELSAYVDAEIEKLAATVETLATDPDKVLHISGHFYEAAVAYYKATGKRRMLDIAVKAADTIAADYGPGKRTYVSDHEGLKIGLLRLFRLTGDERYYKAAKFFLDERGRDDLPRSGEYARDRRYAQDHKPVVSQDEAVGHAVRATFLYIAMTDVAALSGDPRYAAALDRIWDDMTSGKTYLTGGIGSIRFHEQFGARFELPNLSAWNETCAAYGNVVWNHRMSLLHRDAKYVDMMERVLYNGFLAGVSAAGDRFFYQNPLMSYGDYERFEWINVPCCPPNVVRLMASVGGYVYAKDAGGVTVNLFVGSDASFEAAGTDLRIRQETRYPWDGKVKILLDPARPVRFALRVRVPGWAGNSAWPDRLYEFMEDAEDAPRLSVNGRPAAIRAEQGYAVVEREWRAGDSVELDLPMPVRRVWADRRVADDAGRVALARGPLVYCAEWPDNGGHALNIVIPDDAAFASDFRPGLLGGVQAVTGRVLAIRRGADGNSVETVPHELTAVPYFAWANRGRGEMAVWIARRGNKAWLAPVPADPVAKVTAGGGVAKRWTGYNDQSDSLAAVYDGRDPLNSADESYLYYRLRPAEGEPAWIEYEFKAPTTISSAAVYWVDDRRFCRPPAGWRIEVREGGRYRPVKARGPYGVEKDRFNETDFDPVTATAVRLVVEPRAVRYSAGDIGPPDAMFIDKPVLWRECGVIEWRVR